MYIKMEFWIKNCYMVVGEQENVGRRGVQTMVPKEDFIRKTRNGLLLYTYIIWVWFVGGVIILKVS